MDNYSFEYNRMTFERKRRHMHVLNYSSFKHKLFTIIELLVVVAVIMILASLLLPALSKVKEKSREINCLSNLHHIGTGMHMYANDYNAWTPGLTSSYTSIFQTKFIKTGTKWLNWGLYYDLGYLSTSTLFMCPLVSNKFCNYLKSIGSSSATEFIWTDKEQLGADPLDGYHESTYFTRVDENDLHRGIFLTNALSKKAMAADFFYDSVLVHGVSVLGHSSGKKINVLYSDAHVEARDNPKTTNASNNSLLNGFASLDK